MAYKGRLLLVDDDPKVRTFYSAIFERAGFLANSCENLEQMRERVGQISYDAIFLDLNLKGENGLDGLPFVLKTAPYSKVFILTSQKGVSKAVECMDRGATWYFTKGSDPQGIVEKLQECISEDIEEPGDSEESWRKALIGDSPAIAETCETIRKLRQVDSTVLILGESGTGKEVVARSLHRSSQRSLKRFEAINCGAIPENLLESELLGHKKGAFTDAKADRKGIFEVCCDGTLLLDEIGDMPLVLQTKLLRVLQEKKVTPVGATAPLEINTRLIAATHRDILDEVKCGRFREDLYYRLSVVVINIPALRHRKSDISLLTLHFLNSFNKRFGKDVQPPSPGDLKRLESYDWPGNIRELQNAIERGVVLSSNNRLTTENMFSHLSFRQEMESAASASEPSQWEQHEVFDMPLSDAKQFFEKTYMKRLLKMSEGNMAEVARRSGRYRADLYRMLERYEIAIDEFRNTHG